MQYRKTVCIAGIVLAIGLVGAGRAEARQADACDQGCLLQLADTLLNSIAVDAPGDIPASPRLKIMQDGREIKPGEGVWKTATSFSHRHTVVDPVSGQFVFFGFVFAPENPSVVFIRSKVEARQIAEIEILRVEQAQMPGMFRPEGLGDLELLWETPIPKSAQSPRKAMIARASSYFDALQSGNPDDTAFHPDCFRSENGQWTTNFPPRYPRSCSEGIRYLGGGAIKVTSRRFPVVDVERGLVLAAVVFDRDSRGRETYEVNYRGKKRSVQIPAARAGTSSGFVYEMFKIEHGRIRAVTATFKNGPEYLSRPWPED